MVERLLVTDGSVVESLHMMIAGCSAIRSNTPIYATHECRQKGQRCIADIGVLHMIAGCAGTLIERLLLLCVVW